MALAGLPNGASAQRIAPPNPPNIWLHYDYMVGADGHSHAPSPEAIRIVVEAFRAQGIALHIDPHHAAIPESEYLVFEGHSTTNCGPDPGVNLGFPAANFFELKAQYFQPRGPQPWHYAIFGHFSFDCISLGLAEIGGYNFMVTLGRDFGPILCPACTPDVLLRFEAGYTMHELGHNLGLRHGGANDDPFKPNYISVMNQLYAIGIRYAASPGSIEPAGLRFDYSGRALPPLDEQHLDERLGVQAGTTDIVSYLCLPPGHLEPEFVEGLGPGTGPIDWNCNGVIEPDVAQDIDIFPGLVYPEYRVLTGFDDWAHVHHWIRTPAYVTGTLRPTGIVP